MRARFQYTLGTTIYQSNHDKALGALDATTVRYQIQQIEILGIIYAIDPLTLGNHLFIFFLATFVVLSEHARSVAMVTLGKSESAVLLYSTGTFMPMMCSIQLSLRRYDPIFQLS